MIDSFSHRNKKSKREITSSNTIEDFENKLGPRPAIVADPKKEAEKEMLFETEIVNNLAMKASENDREKEIQKVRTTLAEMPIANEPAYTPINCPYHPPLNRKVRKGVLNWLWDFLFEGNDNNGADHSELKFHEFQTSIQLASVKQGINQNAANSKLFYDNQKNLIYRLNGITVSLKSYEHNEIMILMATQTVSVQQTLKDFQVQYLEWTSENNLIMSMDQAKDEYQSSLPQGTSPSKGSNEELLAQTNSTDMDRNKRRFRSDLHQSPHCVRQSPRNIKNHPNTRLGNNFLRESKSRERLYRSSNLAPRFIAFMPEKESAKSLQRLAPFVVEHVLFLHK